MSSLFVRTEKETATSFGVTVAIYMLDSGLFMDSGWSP